MNKKHLYITFEKALENNFCCILEGESVERLKTKNQRINFIKEKVPMCFEKINETILKELGHIGYIDFWSNIKIKKANI